jgi:hypothetical protein
MIKILSLKHFMHSEMEKLSIHFSIKNGENSHSKNKAHKFYCFHESSKLVIYLPMEVDWQ